MKISELIEVLKGLQDKYGDVEVKKLKNDYLISIFKNSIVYNIHDKVIEL